MSGAWTARVVVEDYCTQEKLRTTYEVKLASLAACQHWARHKFLELGNLRFRVVEAVAIDPEGNRHGLVAPS